MAYDITRAFERIERELISSMVRNMKRHRVEEIDKDIQWTQWQVLQLQGLDDYKRKYSKKYKKQFRTINAQLESALIAAKEQGDMDAEIAILNALRKGWRAPNGGPKMDAQFFRLNERKMDALVRSVTHDMEKAEHAVLRFAEDHYRRIIFDAQVYANSGAGTYEKAVDMATDDFISKGINCIQYANGARVGIAAYVDMAIRTASKRAYLMGEGAKRAEWGIHTVIMNKRTNACPKCMPFEGKVLIDDVWSGGSADEGPYPLMSSAIAAGLYHPNCKDIHTTYFPGVSTPPEDKFTKQELADVEERERLENKKSYVKRQAEKCGRLADYSLDKEKQQKYREREGIWRKQAKELTQEIKEIDDRRGFQFLKGFHTFDDPVREYLGSAFESHPKETQILLDKLKEIGVEVNIVDREKMVYGPSGTKGKPGNITICRNASYSALLHEYTHAMEDYSIGFTAMTYFLNPEKYMDFERRAYQAEIDFCRSQNLPEECIMRLEMLRDKEIEHIKERWGLK